MRIDFHRIPEMARATGLEPAASGVTGRRSNQLSYARISRTPLEEGEGLQPCPAPVKRGARRASAPPTRVAADRLGPRLGE